MYRIKLSLHPVVLTDALCDLVGRAFYHNETSFPNALAVRFKNQPRLKRAKEEQNTFEKK